MTKLTNTTDVNLGLPGGPVVPAGKTIEAKDWAKQEHDSVVQSWVRAGALKVESDEKDDDKPANKVK